jgi:carboxypeptidase Q
MKNGVIVIAVLMLFAAGVAPAQSDVERVMAEAAKPSPLEHNLEVLTDEIGGRVPGTPAMQRALDWGVDAFQAAGGEKVHLESFSIPQSWAEGATRISVTAPVNFRVRGVSLAWTPPTKGVIRGRVVDVGEGSAQDLKQAGKFEDSVLLVHSGVLHTWDDLFEEYLQAPPIIAAAIKGKAAGIAFMATREHDILYRHINNMFGTIEKLPMVLLAREDAERIGRLSKSAPVELELDVRNHVGGPIESSNVVAELRGSEKPSEFIVLGAHLDSWELGTGALDDGCNAALVVDALRAIKKSGVRPKRSIRFVLFSGEEQGTLGSWAYVRAHRAELNDAVAAIMFDEGSGATTGFSLGGRKDLVSVSQELVAPFKPWNADQLTTDAFVGTDNLDFLLEGVPTLVANQKEANYLENYHATSDTYDKVYFPQLKKHVAIAAALALAIANRPERVGPRQTRPEVEQLMRETKLDDELKIFDMWGDWASGKRGRR